jgi:hypothetical protein
MAQVLEYALVFVCSLMVAGFSAGAYTTYLSAVYRTQSEVQVTTIADAAAAALRDGSGTVTADISGVTMACHGDTLYVVSGSATKTVPAAGGCDFSLLGFSGVHRLTFVSGPGPLSVGVA